MADKYLKDSSGVLTEQAATVASTGASDAGKIIALDSVGKIDTTMVNQMAMADILAFAAAHG